MNLVRLWGGIAFFGEVLSAQAREYSLTRELKKLKAD